MYIKTSEEEVSYPKLKKPNSKTYQNIPFELSAAGINYPYVMIPLILFFALSPIAFPLIFTLFWNFMYFLQSSFKFYLFQLNIKNTKTIPIRFSNNISDKQLPIYTILVPLYHEEGKVKSIVRALLSLNYPKDKLDIKILVEPDDLLTRQLLENIKLPSFIKVIKVADIGPKTKPKALNYVLKDAKGKFLTVYDAEDRPEVNQLRDAVIKFSHLPEEYACLQASLNFYNQNKNLLTAALSIEYNLWFDYILRGLNKLNLAMPLGGTSNHFKVDVLQKVGGWDAFNVTEDAELGVRLHLSGYKCEFLNSRTWEESPERIYNWLRQRSRWIKGFMQTFLVFIRQYRFFKNIISALLIFLSAFLFVY